MNITQLLVVTERAHGLRQLEVTEISFITEDCGLTFNFSLKIFARSLHFLLIWKQPNKVKYK